MNDLSKWADTTHEPELIVEMVDPHNLDVSRGKLDGVTNLTMTDGYYSNTKVSGSLTTIADNYIGGSWLRVRVDGLEIATFGVQKVHPKQAPEKAEEKSYDLQSVLWMIDEDIWTPLYTIAAKTQASTILKNVADIVGKSLVLMPGFNDGWFGSAVAYEHTDSFRSILADVCSRYNDQLGVNGHGQITAGPYRDPASKEVSWPLDADDEKGIILDPGYEDEDATGSAYNRTIVIASSSDSNAQPIVASSDAPASDEISSSYRGWTRAKVHQVSEMTPYTQARAQQLVNQYKTDDRSKGKTRSCTCIWFPVKGGEVVDYIQNGKHKKWLVQTAEHNFINWTVALTLKEV